MKFEICPIGIDTFSLHLQVVSNGHNQNDPHLSRRAKAYVMINQQIRHHDPVICVGPASNQHSFCGFYLLVLLLIFMIE